MSLIHLSSYSYKQGFQEAEEQDGNDFQNHFPVAIRLKPNSKICLQTLDLSDPDDGYVIDEHNNLLAVQTSDSYPEADFVYARLPKKSNYDGDGLASALQSAISSAILTQNLTATVAYDDTSHKSFNMTLNQSGVALPTASSGTWEMCNENSGEAFITKIDSPNVTRFIRSSSSQAVKSAVAVENRGVFFTDPSGVSTPSVTWSGFVSSGIEPFDYSKATDDGALTWGVSPASGPSFNFAFTKLASHDYFTYKAEDSTNSKVYYLNYDNFEHTELGWYLNDTDPTAGGVCASLKTRLDSTSLNQIAVFEIVDSSQPFPVGTVFTTNESKVISENDGARYYAQACGFAGQETRQSILGGVDASFVQFSSPPNINYGFDVPKTSRASTPIFVRFASREEKGEHSTVGDLEIYLERPGTQGSKLDKLTAVLVRRVPVQANLYPDVKNTVKIETQCDEQSFGFKVLLSTAPSSAGSYSLAKGFAGTLSTAISPTDTTIVLSEATTNLKSSGMLIIAPGTRNREVIHYTSKNDSTRTISGITRGGNLDSVGFDEGSLTPNNSARSHNMSVAICTYVGCNGGTDGVIFDSSDVTYYDNFFVYSANKSAFNSAYNQTKLPLFGFVSQSGKITGKTLTLSGTFNPDLRLYDGPLKSMTGYGDALRSSLSMGTLESSPLTQLGAPGPSKVTLYMSNFTEPATQISQRTKLGDTIGFAATDPNGAFTFSTSDIASPGVSISGNAPVDGRSFGNFHVQLGDLGIRSYKGAKSDIGRSIAIVNRSQFLLSDNASEKVRLHYVAPFENWIDVNNAEDLELNQ